MKEDNPAFLGPNVKWVYCFVCGEAIEAERANGMDISSDEEYYPLMKPVCPKHGKDSN